MEWVLHWTKITLPGNTNYIKKESVEVVTESTTAPVMSAVCDNEYLAQHFVLQSADLEEAEEVVTLTQLGESVIDEQTTTFIDNEGGVFVDAPTSDNVVALVDGTEDISLGSFLGRPTKIDTTTWSTADVNSVKQSIFPWLAFLNDTRIKKKIDNYAFLRGKLHIKVVVNGTPFQFGAMRLCYSPLQGLVSNKIRAGVAFQNQLTPYSQVPGFYIYPQANAGGEMVLPFFYHKNWLDITSNVDTQRMGRLDYVIFAPLGVAVTGGTSSVTIQTYAWMSDVHLMGSTNKLALQAKDEYGNGVVSKPASALATMASSFSKVPYIGKFARATEIGADATSRIASLFGYTNVPVISDIHGFQPMNGPMLASSHIGTAVQKLTLDPKQELSIDPSFHGIGSADELSIPYLKQKESFFGQTSWSTSDIIGTQLFNTRINPFLHNQEDVLGPAAAVVGKRAWHTPVSYLGHLFRHWRGDLIIRVKIVCTKFHKGRLKISYDPLADITTSDPSENAVYTHIVDIGEQDDLEIRVPYHQALAWLELDTTLQSNWSPGNANAPRPNIDNGVMTVRVLTALTAPAAGSIQLLFFVRGAPNLEYANPVDHIGSTTSTLFQTPSLFPLQASDKTDVITKQVMMGSPSFDLPERYGLNFGENISSLRDLLHRSSIVDTVSNPFTQTGLMVTSFKNYQRMPTSPGFLGVYPTVANTVVSTPGTFNYCFNSMHPLTFVSSMFLGYRGGVNYNVTVSSDTYGFIDDIRVNRKTNSVGVTTQSVYLAQSVSLGYTPSQNQSAAFLNVGQYMRDGVSGLAITSNRTNASLSFNIPDYNGYNFSLPSFTTYPTGYTLDGTADQGALLQITLKARDVATNNAQTTLTVSSAACAAPDFTCLFFLCCPTLDYMRNLPVGA